MIWSEMAMRLRKSGQGTDIVHRVVEALREEVSAGSLAGGSRRWEPSCSPLCSGDRRCYGPL